MKYIITNSGLALSPSIDGHCMIMRALLLRKLMDENLDRPPILSMNFKSVPRQPRDLPRQQNHPIKPQCQITHLLHQPITNHDVYPMWHVYIHQLKHKVSPHSVFLYPIVTLLSNPQQKRLSSSKDRKLCNKEIWLPWQHPEQLPPLECLKC